MGNLNGSSDKSTPARLRRIVEETLQVHTWHDGYAVVECPGSSSHSTNSGQTVVFIDRGYPVLCCFHASCQSAVQDVNREFQARRRELPGGGEPQEPSSEIQATIARRKQLRDIKLNFQQFVLPELRKDAVSEEQWREASPYPVANVPADQHWKLFISAVFPPNRPHYIWAGERWESGPDYTNNFKTREEWLDSRWCPGQQIGTFLFIRANGYRRYDNLLYRVLQVLECDPEPGNSNVPDKREFGGVILWAAEYMWLRAIVDTGGKSYHAAFEPFEVPRLNLPPPPAFDEDEKAHAAWKKVHDDAWARRRFILERAYPRRREELMAKLEGLGCDPKMLKGNYTMRLPGADRLDERNELTGRQQRLIYLDPKYEVIL